MYMNGYGVTQNYQQALKWETSAAQKGDAAGQFNLGLLYLHGQGTKADKQEALKWLQLSAGQGFESAKTLLTELQ
jgi:TPR repeat protein